MQLSVRGSSSRQRVVVVREEEGGYGRGLDDGLLWPLPVAQYRSRSV